jgi:hypothetical protein
VNLLFARCGVDAAPAPTMAMVATISAARPAKRPPLERDILLLPLSCSSDRTLLGRVEQAAQNPSFEP